MNAPLPKPDKQIVIMQGSSCVRVHDGGTCLDVYLSSMGDVTDTRTMRLRTEAREQFLRGVRAMADGTELAVRMTEADVVQVANLMERLFDSHGIVGVDQLRVALRDMWGLP